jgi:hypothetical protein
MLETNARGVRIKNPWSHYDIPWVAVRGIEIVGAGDGESPVAAGEHYLRFTVDSDANPSGSKAARPDGSGPDTVVTGRLVAVRAHCTQMADVGRLEDLRHRILAARDAAIAEHSGEGGAVEVRGAARILWNFPQTRTILKIIGTIVVVLAGIILAVIQISD